MRITHHAELSNLNVFRVGARARHLLRLDSCNADGVAEEIAEFFTNPQLKGLPQLVLARGTNVLFVGDFPGVLIMLGGTGVTVEDQGDSIILTAASAHDWHQIVRFSVSQGWGGIENLSLIPGSIGAAPVQNIGAYGVQLSDVFHDLEAVPLSGGPPLTMDSRACGFGYRDSIFKHNVQDKVIVTQVRIRLKKNPVLKLEYLGIRQELNDLGVIEPSVADVSRAIIRLRSRKLPDPDRIPNAGSFFKNPVLTSDQYAYAKEHCAELKGIPEGLGYKVPAAQLIEACGLRGRRFGKAGIAVEHALVIVNYGGASGQELLSVVRRVEGEVLDRFGVQLEREVRVIQEGYGT